MGVELAAVVQRDGQIAQRRLVQEARKVQAAAKHRVGRNVHRRKHLQRHQLQRRPIGETGNLLPSNRNNDTPSPKSNKQTGLSCSGPRGLRQG